MKFSDLYLEELTKPREPSLASYVRENYGEQVAVWLFIDLVRGGFVRAGGGVYSVSVAQFLKREISSAIKRGGLAGRKFCEAIKGHVAFEYYNELLKVDYDDVYGIGANEILNTIFSDTENRDLKYKTISGIICIEYGIICKQDNMLSVSEEACHFLLEQSRMQPIVQSVEKELDARAKLSRILDIVSKVKEAQYAYAVQKEFEELIEETAERCKDQSRQYYRMSALSDDREIKDFFRENGIRCLYHFTDRRNLSNIRRLGLISKRELDEADVKAYCGGNAFSLKMDKEKGIDRFVRLSFCKEHPMLYVRLKDNRYRDFVILEISLDVLDGEVYFSDINAIDSESIIKSGLEGAKNIDIDITQKNYFELNDEEKKKYQAEVLIECVPTDYILNLNNPISVS